MKKTVLLSLDDQELLDTRKYLYENGLALQDLLSVVVELLSVRDERLNFIIKRAVTNKQEILLRKEKFRKIEADVLYSSIEESLRERQGKD